ncbi:MAG: hydantoinase B/oxoprolinase family protein [Balneolaceae bacterium]
MTAKIMKTPQYSAPTKIYIDTGGTFTDCLAITPNGSTKRCKVLSNSTIRGLITNTESETRFQIKTGFELKKNFYTGYKFKLLNRNSELSTIIQHDEQTNTITLDRKLEHLKNPDIPIPFEIVSPEEAPILATRIITDCRLDEPLPFIRMRLSTTKGTNALLERRGGKTLFLITEGYKDLLKIKNQQRPDLFCLNIQKPEPFYHQMIEVPERLDATGKILRKLDLNVIKNRIEPILHEFDAVAICLMHSYLNPDHELQIEKMLADLGMDQINVSRSSKLNPTIKFVQRAITADVNAYLSSPMQRYLNRISSLSGNESLQIMSSAGSLVKASHYTPKDGLFSGPAGGVIGAISIAKRVSPDYSKVITFDMGGTSTDVARFDGKMDYLYEHTVGDATLAAPAIDIETVAAGGGSICEYDGQSLTVGPQSAGAIPGPACYDRGGPLTITDVNLLSGRLHPSNFQISINLEAAENELTLLLKRINENRKDPLNREEVLNGFLNIANERMAQAVQKISIQKGFDPKEYIMVAFGGAGAQHALAVSQKLGIKSVLVPSDAGLLSAYGLQQAKTEEIHSLQVLKKIDDPTLNLPKIFQDLEEKALKALDSQGVENLNAIKTDRFIFMRFFGQESCLELNWIPQSNLDNTFKKMYTGQFGHWIDNRPIEIESIRVIARETDQTTECTVNNVDPSLVGKKSPGDHINHHKTHSHTHFLSHNKYLNAPIFMYNDLDKETQLTGPVLILYPYSTSIIEPGWKGKLLSDGTWLMEQISKPKDNNKEIKKAVRHSGSHSSHTTESEAVLLQLFTNRFRSIADQMGEMLRKTAISVNIKERLDYSCAILDPNGYLVVNAPHIPVHLGAMGTCVRTVLETIHSNPSKLIGTDLPHDTLKIEDGDILITNHPAFGGSHLPDITVITPVFFNGIRIGFTASRAHHAEIGGKNPGSMPPDASNLAEEGVIIPPMFLAKRGVFNWDIIESMLKKDPWPSRLPDENMADLRAAVSANHRGASGMIDLATLYGTDETIHQMKELRKYASNRLKYTLSKIPNGFYSAEERMDDGSLLKVNCSLNKNRLKIDFTGSADTHPGNLNANPSIVRSVIMYVLRLLINDPLPLNDGLLDPVDITIPKGLLNPEFPDDPGECPAVVGGNIETSQRLTDTLLKAFELTGCSYGTMNNVLFGNKRFGYYETIAGGTGAGLGFNGADAVHQHMTNTLAADPEILEYRYPVRLDRYEIRMNSGGSGKWKGGDGLIREMTFLEPVTLSVLTQHRITPPYGMKGGSKGLCGKQWIETKNGSKKKLNWIDGVELNEGDRFIIETPGGGGFGEIE